MKNENKSSLTFEQARIFRDKVLALAIELDNMLAINNDN